MNDSASSALGWLFNGDHVGAGTRRMRCETNSQQFKFIYLSKALLYTSPDLFSLFI